jgi:signal transduction histidine kinase
MQALRVLLVDTTGSTKKLFDNKRMNGDSLRLNVRLAGIELQPEELENLHETVDVVLFGEKVPPATVLNMTKKFRLIGLSSPILMLTRQSEARVPQKYKKVGVDDMLNIAEIQTPLFLWTFQSTMTQIADRNKAKEFDIVKDRLRRASKSLAFVTHEINNPLSVIRLALYHLESGKLPQNKKKVFFKLLVDNIEKVDAQMKELYSIRRQLSSDSRNGKRRSMWA